MLVTIATLVVAVISRKLRVATVVATAETTTGMERRAETTTETEPLQGQEREHGQG